MRTDLPDAVHRHLAERAPTEGPELLFHRATLASNLRDAAVAARDAGITLLFAAKSFPHPEVLALAATHLDGFDVASPGELASVTSSSPRILSIADPTGRTLTELPRDRAARTLVSCDSAATLAAALAAGPHVEPALRLSSSLTGRDPALGAVQSGQGHHRSRFGLDLGPGDDNAALVELVRLANGRPLGLHVHASELVPTSTARVLDTARAALARATAAGLAPKFLNLGGGWHALPEPAATWRALREALPSELELIAEPGRLFAREAGFAIGTIRAVRRLADRELCVLDLSRVCHLRWSQLELVAAAPRPGSGRKVLFAGPTCYEDDVLGEWTVDPDEALSVGRALVFRGVTGYAAAWNTGFGGLAAAKVCLQP